MHGRSLGMSIRAATLLFIAFWLVLGLYFAFEGMRLGLGRFSSPGTGFMPFAIGIVLIGFCIASALPVLTPQARIEAGRLAASRFAAPAIIVAALIVYALVLERIGFIASTVILVVFLARTVGGIALFKASLFGAAVAAFCHVVFSALLGVRLP